MFIRLKQGRFQSHTFTIVLRVDLPLFLKIPPNVTNANLKNSSMIMNFDILS